MLVRARFARHDKAPGAPPTIKGRLRGCTAVTGFSRVAVSNTCRSSRRGSAGESQPTSGSYGNSLVAEIGIHIEGDELTRVHTNTTRASWLWSSGASPPAGPSTHPVSRRPSTGSHSKRSASACPRSSRSVSSMLWTATGRTYEVTRPKAPQRLTMLMLPARPVDVGRCCRSPQPARRTARRRAEPVPRLRARGTPSPSAVWPRPSDR
ncbi:hypothetical protein SAMN06272765_3964 [Streptomyces sp. Ag109_G2-15]|nr:hypothetical protein SAMN06272765_3964 [Streptomyces sp. Ag109_G2-15]